MGRYLDGQQDERGILAAILTGAAILDLLVKSKLVSPRHLKFQQLILIFFVALLPSLGINNMFDFCISAVRYDSENQHIEWVKVHEDKGATIGPARQVPRAFVADLIRLEKATFQTVIKMSNGNFANGAHIHVIDDIYLTTDRNNTKRDNLGNLPTF